MLFITYQTVIKARTMITDLVRTLLRQDITLTNFWSSYGSLFLTKRWRLFCRKRWNCMSSEYCNRRTWQQTTVKHMSSSSTCDCFYSWLRAYNCHSEAPVLNISEFIWLHPYSEDGSFIFWKNLDSYKLKKYLFWIDGDGRCSVRVRQYESNKQSLRAGLTSNSGTVNSWQARLCIQWMYVLTPNVFLYFFEETIFSNVFTFCVVTTLVFVSRSINELTFCALRC